MIITVYSGDLFSEARDATRRYPPSYSKMAYDYFKFSVKSNNEREVAVNNPADISVIVVYFVVVLAVGVWVSCSMSLFTLFVNP